MVWFDGDLATIMKSFWEACIGGFRGIVGEYIAAVGPAKTRVT